LEILLSNGEPSISMQVLKPVGLGLLAVIMLIGIIALITELIEAEEIAKTVVIPSLILLIIVTGYAIFQSYNRRF
jgi:hypothetical protein